jgi:hypothetical protein
MFFDSQSTDSEDRNDGMVRVTLCARKVRGRFMLFGCEKAGMMSTPTSLTHNLSTAESLMVGQLVPTHAHITPADVTISETGKIDNNRIDLKKLSLLQAYGTSQKRSGPSEVPSLTSERRTRTSAICTLDFLRD